MEHRNQVKAIFEAFISKIHATDEFTYPGNKKINLR